MKKEQQIYLIEKKKGVFETMRKRTVEKEKDVISRL